MADLATGARTVHIKDENGIEILTTPEDFTCFICHKKFQSMDEMRHHVKFPCNASKIVTSRVPHPKNSVPVFIESMPSRHSWDQTQGIEIHQPVASYIPEQNQQQQQHVFDQHLQAGGSVEVQMQDSGIERSFTTPAVSYDAATGVGTSAVPVDQEEQKNLTPTTIYVNEKGETVIEVENLDLSSDGGELSLAHLLTQLSQQGIVFDKSRSASLQAQDFVLETGREQQQSQVYEVENQNHVNVQQDPHNISQVRSEVMVESESLVVTPAKEEEEEEGQPTAEDAANTLAQLAGFRGYIQKQHQEAGPGSIIQQSQGPQTVEMIQLSQNGSADAVASALPVAQTVQAYQYANPVTIQYTYPTSHSAAVVSDQRQQQEHAHNHHIVGAQHMTLQEVLTAGSATQLYIEAEPETVTQEAEVKPSELSELESVRYIVDPVTGHQVMQQIQDDCLTEDHESSAQPSSEVLYVSAQDDSTKLHHVNSHAEDVARHPVVMTSESNASQSGMELNSTTSAEPSTITVASGEELVHMEVEQEPSHQQEGINTASDDKSRAEDRFPVHTVSLQEVASGNQSESDNVSFHTQPTVAVLDSSETEKVVTTLSSVQVTQCVSVGNIQTIAADQADLQLVSVNTASTDPGSDSHSVADITNHHQGTIPQVDTDGVDNELQNTTLILQSERQHQEPHTQGIQGHYEVVTCHDLEEDIPAIPVGVVPVNVVNMAASTYPGHSHKTELGAETSVERNILAEAHAVEESQPSEELGDPHHCVSMNEIAADNVVTDPHSVTETDLGVTVAEASVGAGEQEFVELQEGQQHQQQAGMSTMFVVTSTGIQPVPRHKP